MRTGKELILATREYAKDDSVQSWVAITSTATLLLVFALAVALLPYWFLKLPAAVLLGMVMVMRVLPNAVRRQGKYAPKAHKDLSRFRFGQNSMVLVIMIDDKHPNHHHAQ